MSAEEQARIHNEIIAQSEEVEELFWDPVPRDDVPLALRKWVSDNVEEAILAFAKSINVMWEIKDGCLIGRIYSSEWLVPDIDDLPPIDFGAEIEQQLRILWSEAAVHEQFAQALEDLAARVRADMERDD